MKVGGNIIVESFFEEELCIPFHLLAIHAEERKQIELHLYPVFLQSRFLAILPLFRYRVWPCDRYSDGKTPNIFLNCCE